MLQYQIYTYAKLQRTIINENLWWNHRILHLCVFICVCIYTCVCAYKNCTFRHGQTFHLSPSVNCHSFHIRCVDLWSDEGRSWDPVTEVQSTSAPLRRNPSVGCPRPHPVQRVTWHVHQKVGPVHAEATAGALIMPDVSAAWTSPAMYWLCRIIRPVCSQASCSALLLMCVWTTISYIPLLWRWSLSCVATFYAACWFCQRLLYNIMFTMCLPRLSWRDTLVLFCPVLWLPSAVCVLGSQGLDMCHGVYADQLRHCAERLSVRCAEVVVRWHLYCALWNPGP